MMNKARSYLGLAMRAGKLVTGDEGVLKAVRDGSAKLVVLAADASDNTKKKYADKCGYHRVKLVEGFGREELGACIGKEERVAVAVTEPGFARMIGQCLGEITEVKNID